MTWEYLAGFTDGDGCITREWGRGKKYPHARLRWAQKQSDAAVLFDIAEFLRTQGLKVSTRNFSVAYAGHRYPQMELGITNADDTCRALEAMLPYLIVKRERAIEAVSLLASIRRLKSQYGNKYRVALRGVA